MIGRHLFNRQKIGLIFCVFALMIVHSPVIAAADKPTFTREQLSEDLDETFSLLTLIQPNVGRHTSVKELRRLRNALKASLKKSNTGEDAYMKLTSLVGAVCDEHTQILRSEGHAIRMPGGWPWYEKPLIIKDKKLYVELASTDIKAQVISVNGIDGSVFATEIARRMPHDGCFQSGVLYVDSYLAVSGAVFNALVGQPEQYTIELALDGSPVPISITTDPVVSYVSSIFARKSARLSASNRLSALRKKYFWRRLNSPVTRKAELEYFYSNIHDMAYLRIGSFADYETVKEGIEIVMRDIISENPKALFIDLIDNPGGSSNSAQFLMAFLLPRAHRLHSRVLTKDVARKPPTNFSFIDSDAEATRKSRVKFFRRVKPRGGIRSAPMAKRSFGMPDYKGKIYVMVGPGSHSNAMRVAANLKRLRNATIVGNVTASNITSACARASGSYKLKNTGFTLYVPETCYESPENRIKQQNTLIPDIAVDVFKGRTTDIAAVTLRTALEHHLNPPGQ